MLASSQSRSPSQIISRAMPKRGHTQPTCFAHLLDLRLGCVQPIRKRLVPRLQLQPLRVNFPPSCQTHFLVRLPRLLVFSQPKQRRTEPRISLRCYCSTCCMRTFAQSGLSWTQRSASVCAARNCFRDAYAAERLLYSTWLLLSIAMASEKCSTASGNFPAENAALPWSFSSSTYAK